MKRDGKAANLLGVRYPIIQGPFGGGLSTARLAALVSNLGGLGSYGAHLLEPTQIEELGAEMQSLTDRPFAINLWVSDRDEGLASLTEDAFVRRSRDYDDLYQALGVAPPAWPGIEMTGFELQAEAVMRVRPKVFSFVFGIPDQDILVDCAKRGIVTVGAATTLEEVEALEAAGVDMAVVSGCEAGGHRPSFLRSAEESLVTTLALVPAARDRVSMPLIAAGGIAEARALRAAFELGADAVQVGSAFLACDESGAQPAHKAALLADREGRSVLSRAYTGRLARFIPNRFTERIAASPTASLPYPAQGWLTAPIKTGAEARGKTDLMAFYASQAAPLIRHRSAAQLMATLIDALP